MSWFGFDLEEDDIDCHFGRFSFGLFKNGFKQHRHFFVAFTIREHFFSDLNSFEDPHVLDLLLHKLLINKVLFLLVWFDAANVVVGCRL